MSDFKQLGEKAKEIRKLVITSVTKAKSGHPGGALSCADLMAALYFEVMDIRPEEPLWEERDRFILSKGHSCPALYAALALRGFFPMEELDRLRRTGSMLQGHPCAGKTPGIDASTGSLGQGLSIANGIALGAKLDNKNFYTYCLMGDGETEEGQVWEAAMTAAHYRLNHVIAFVDHNHLQIDGTIEEVIGNRDIALKFRAFGWKTVTVDGHNLEEIIRGIQMAKSSRSTPVCIILNTVKGKGVSFMENKASWHGSAPTPDQAACALSELEGM